MTVFRPSLPPESCITTSTLRFGSGVSARAPEVQTRGSTIPRLTIPRPCLMNLRLFIGIVHPVLIHLKLLHAHNHVKEPAHVFPRRVVVGHEPDAVALVVGLKVVAQHA